MRKIIVTKVCPPIPIRNYDWSCALDDDEESMRGWGATKREALNDLLENEDVDAIADHFGITTTFVDPCLGPEHGHWLAVSGTDSVESPWRECAIAELAHKLAEPEL